jgi:hypothetical protein
MVYRVEKLELKVVDFISRNPCTKYIIQGLCQNTSSSILISFDTDETTQIICIFSRIQSETTLLAPK